VTRTPLRLIPENSILSRHLDRLSSPVRTLVLPYHAEQVAMALAGASSPEPTSSSSSRTREVERYFDVAAVVGGLRNNSDSEHSL
jgi:hypothetical protein